MDTKSLERSIKSIIKTGQGYGTEFMPVLRETKNILKRINKGKPTAENYFLLGTLCLKLEDNLQAAEAFKVGYQLNKKHLHCGTYYALILEQLGQWQEALTIYQELSNSDPENIQIVERMLSILYQQKDIKMLLTLCYYFLEKKSFYPLVYEYISKFYYDCGNIVKAIEYLNNALTIDADNQYYKNRLIHHLFKNHQFQSVLEFKDYIKQTVSVPLSIKLLYANSLAEIEENTKARTEYVAILREAEDKHTVLAEIALFHIKYEMNNIKGDFINQYILKRDPNNISALTNLALTSDQEFSIPAYEKVLKQYPDNPLFRMNYGAQLIHVGRLEEGFEYYESRIERMQPFLSGRLNYPADITNKKLFIWNDQGIGDLYGWSWVFQFIKDENIQIKIQIDERLIDIMSRSFPAITFISEQPIELAYTEDFSEYDAEMAIGSFAKYFIAEIKAAQNEFEKGHIRGPHLIIDENKLSYWKNRLQALTSNKTVGICWRSGLLGGIRNLSYLSAENIIELFIDMNCSIINLQYDYTEDEIELIQTALGDRFINFTDIDLKNDQDELAALIGSLDLVFTAATAVMGLSGALGVKTLCISGGGSFGKSYDIMLPTVEGISGPYQIRKNSQRQKAELFKALNN